MRRIGRASLVLGILWVLCCSVSSAGAADTMKGGRVPPVGDANSDGTLDIADSVFILLFLFSGGPAPACPGTSDVNLDSTLDITDAVFILNYLFLGGQPPMTPGMDCVLAEQCTLKTWVVDCLGHWACVCGECREVCDFEGCGDGVCDVDGGETPESCPEDCKPGSLRPVCGAIGSRSEGWYDAETGKLIRYAFCAGCQAECRHCGSKSEGWYDACTGELIRWDQCECAAE